MNSDTDRIVFLDWLRAIAIFMVLLIHACEPFYLDAEGTAIASKFDAVWVTIIDSAMRAAVPLFVIASAFLLFPVRARPHSLRHLDMRLHGGAGRRLAAAPLQLPD